MQFFLIINIAQSQEENIKRKTGLELKYGTANLHYKNNLFSGKLPEEFILGLNIFPTKFETHVATKSNDILGFLNFVFPIDFVAARIIDSGYEGLKNKIYGISSGFVYRDGYCYKMGTNSSLDFYHSGGVLIGGYWTDEKDSVLKTGTNEFQDFINKVKGWSLNDNYEIGIKYTFDDGCPSILLNYEGKLIYPKIIFWNWLASRAIEPLSQYIIDLYVREIFDQTPTLIPIINFILKSSLTYAIYDLRTQNMHWPFESEPGILLDHFKIGFSFTYN